MRLLKLAGLTVAGALSATAAQAQEPPPAPAPVQAAPQPPAFKLINARKVKKQKWWQVNMLWGSCEYGVYGFGEQFVGGRYERLQARLTEKLGQRLAGQELTLERYEFFTNAQIFQTQSVDKSRPDMLFLNSQSRLKCGREKMRGGWYDDRLLAATPPPYVVEIDVRMNGRTFKATAALTPPKHHPLSVEAMAGPDTAKAAADVQEMAIADLIRQIEAALPKP